MPESKVEFFKSGLFEGFEDEMGRIAKTVDGILRGYSKTQSAINRCKYIESLFLDYKKGLFEEIRAAGPKNEETDLFLIHMLDRLNINNLLLADLQTRVLRRAIYCKLINNLELNQMKIAGLYAYWFNKLHPIVVSSPSDDLERLAPKYEDYLHRVNEFFAFHIVYNIFVEQYGKPSKGLAEYMERFTHALRYRSFTEDSLMLLTESLGKEAFYLASMSKKIP